MLFLKLYCMYTGINWASVKMQILTSETLMGTQFCPGDNSCCRSRVTLCIARFWNAGRHTLTQSPHVALNFAPSLCSQFRTSFSLSKQGTKEKNMSWLEARKSACRAITLGRTEPFDLCSSQVMTEAESTWEMSGAPSIRSPQAQHRVTQRNHRIPPTT